MDKSEKRKVPVNPRKDANPLSIVTFTWLFKTFFLGYRRELEVTDLYAPLDEHSSHFLGDRVARIWEEELERCAKKKSDVQPSLLRVLVRCFGPTVMLYGLIQALLEFFVRITQPLALARLLRYYGGDGEMSKKEAYICAAGVVLCCLINCFVTHPCFQGIMHTGMKLRVACCTLVYRKVLKLSKTALAETTIGQVVNLLSNDVNRFDYAVYFLHYIWLGPLATLVITYLISQEVGWSAVAGTLTILLFIPLQGVFGKMSSVLTLKTALRTDERLRLMNEIINGVQVIKMYTWEKPFSNLVEKARRKEVNSIEKFAMVQGITFSFDMYIPRLCLFVTILAYVLTGSIITAEKVFMISAFYNVLRLSMTIAFPICINQIAETMVSIRRLQKFMMHEEIEKPCIADLSNGLDKSVPLKNDVITMKDCTAKWIADTKENTLSGINLNVKSGELVAVIGQVGAGKTSLLHAILRELPLLNGSLNTQGKVTYASQEPWLFASSVRQNILFGRPMDRERYDRVVDVCQLKRDFALLPYGDKTIVGERGISLSGGQRARINLARAVYTEADIYLLDDPLSAVDAHVGKHIFEECIFKYLKHKTRIIVTHQFQYLKDVDRVIVMSNGAIKHEGTFEELHSLGLDFVKLMNTVNEEETEDEGSTRRSSRRSSIRSGKSDEVIYENPVEVAEARTVGTISGKVYVGYFKAAGSTCLVLGMFLTCILNQVVAGGGDYFITYWVNVEEQSSNLVNDTVVLNWTEGALSRDWCVYLYTAITVVTIVLTFIRTFAFFGVCMRASRKLHANMFYSIIRAPMLFFNTNTSGRILNRFSKDMGAVDVRLPMSMVDVIQIFLALITIIIIVVSINPWLLIPSIFIGAMLVALRAVYIKTSRSVKRLEGLTRSPVFGHLTATLQGMTTIRAFNAEEILTTEFDNHQDLHSSAWFIFISSSRAFGFYLDLLCAIYIGVVTFSFLLFGDEMFAGNVGLVITQCIGLSGMLQWGVRQSAEMENQMTSVERILEYTEVEQEAALETTPEKKPPSNWPSEGRIEFRHLSLRYNVDEPFVLNDLNFVIEPRQKIGIVGRTGAGKSSLIAALFRLAYQEGDIFVDQFAVSSLGLHDLRSKISIIPQEPVLFSGSLRKNLDPFDEYSDEVLWRALEEVELKEAVDELMAGLNSKVSEGGSNFSVGQRQLLCLARAVVKNNQILVLDEATANVDPHTDNLIQETIRRKFEDRTVLTIAHRLNTVMDSTKVLVMDAGSMVEFDQPYILLQNKNGHLYNMVQQTGCVMAETLMKLAEDSYRKRKICSEYQK